MKHKLDSRISFAHNRVAISSIVIHPKLIDRHFTEIDLASTVKDWSSKMITVLVTSKPPICVEINGQYLAVNSINSLRIASQCLPGQTRIPIRIAQKTYADHLLLNELIVEPILNHRHASEIGQAYRSMRNGNEREALKELGPKLQSQKAISELMGLAKNTVFPPSQPSIPEPDECPDSMGENGERAKLNEWIENHES